MTLCEELYFEITLKGRKFDIDRFVTFLRSGELNEFFEFSMDYVFFADGYDDCDLFAETKVVLSNDDYGIEIESLVAEDFLDVFCRAAKALDVNGQLYDIDDEEIRFVSGYGSSYYLDLKHVTRFNEDEDEEAEEDDDE